MNLTKILQRLRPRHYHQLGPSATYGELRIPRFMQRNSALEQRNKDDELRETLAELAETKKELRKTQLSGYTLYQEFNRVRKKYRARRRLVLLAIAAILAVRVAFSFVTDKEKKFTYDGQINSLPLVSVEEGDYLDDYNFYRYDASCLVPTGQLVSGSADISEPLVDVKWWGQYTFDIFVFAGRTAGPANIKLRVPYVVPANEMSAIKVQFQLHDGELWTLAQIPFMTSDRMQFSETNVTQEAELSGKEEIMQYLTNQDYKDQIMKGYKSQVMDDVAKMWHYKVTLEPSEPDYDVTIRYPMGFWPCVIKITMASVIAVVVIWVIGMFATADKDVREDMTYDNLYERFTEKSENEDTDDEEDEDEDEL